MTMFETGNDLTIRQLVERIERITMSDDFTDALGSGAMDARQQMQQQLQQMGRPSKMAQIRDLARQALTNMDRLMVNEDAWVAKFNEAKSLGFSDGESESAADREVHNEITSAVEAHTHDANLAMAIADQAITEALVPTAALLRHLAEQFDTDDMAHIGLTLHTPHAVGAGYALRKIADDMERNG